MRHFAYRFIRQREAELHVEHQMVINLLVAHHAASKVKIDSAFNSSFLCAVEAMHGTLFRDKNSTGCRLSPASLLLRRHVWRLGVALGPQDPKLSVTRESATTRP